MTKNRKDKEIPKCVVIIDERHCSLTIGLLRSWNGTHVMEAIASDDTVESCSDAKVKGA